MRDARYEFFTTSVDQAANRALVHQIAAQAIERLRPEETIFTDLAFDDLLEHAARGEVICADTDQRFGMGGVELLLYAVVPLVANALVTIFLIKRSAGVRGMEQPPTPEEYINRKMIEAMVRQARIRCSRHEIKQLCVILNQYIAEYVAQAINDPNLRLEPRCGSYDCAALRRLLADAFNLNELHELCFELNEHSEDVIAANATRPEGARMVIEYFARRGRLDDLVAHARRARPAVDWSSSMRHADSL